MALTDVLIRAARPLAKTFKLFDGGGLYLEVTPAGGKRWRWKYRVAGKEKRLSFGTYPDVSLKAARAKHVAARQARAADEREDDAGVGGLSRLRFSLRCRPSQDIMRIA